MDCNRTDGSTLRLFKPGQSIYDESIEPFYYVTLYGKTINTATDTKDICIIGESVLTSSDGTKKWLNIDISNIKSDAVLSGNKPLEYNGKPFLISELNRTTYMKEGNKSLLEISTSDDKAY